jgi:hypothetical protein
VKLPKRAFLAIRVALPHRLEMRAASAQDKVAIQCLSVGWLKEQLHTTEPPMSEDCEAARPYISEVARPPIIIQAARPQITEAARPHIIEAVKPHIIEAARPHVIEVVKPHIIEAVRPQTREGVRPQIFVLQPD